MKSRCMIHKSLNPGAHGFRLGFGPTLLLCLFLAPLVHVQAQRQWGGETITSLGGSEYQSPKFGRMSMMGNPSTSNLAWVPGLGSFLDARGSGLWNSPEYGDVERGNDNAGWVTSSRFGWTHFAPNAQTYGGWTWTERFNWMKFERPGASVYLWVPMMRCWMAVLPSGGFHSFEWGTLTPQGLTRYESSIFGGLTTGDFKGWVASDRFGWMWANGDGTWFWSQGRQEWLGVTSGGGIWSTKEGRFLLPTVSPFADLAKIPAGWFIMGDSHDGMTNSPQVNVYVSEFYMARHEVTWALWNEVRNWAVNNGYTDIATGGGKGATHPVHSVSWLDVVIWCNARSEREGLTPVYRNADGTVFKIGTTVPTADWNANGYRLPTEAEWEKAARGGVSGQRFPWGDTITHSQANYFSSSEESYDTSPTREFHPTYATGSTPYTSPVGSFGANGYGLYDMAGNVWEWCWDWYSASAYTEGATDPKGPTSGADRVSRGGAWYISGARNSRSAGRGGGAPDARYFNGGFRPARSSAAPAPENRSISLSGNLDFGGVVVAAESVRQLQIENQGNVDLTVTGLVLPDAFSGNWTGVIAPGATQGVSITFAPQAEQSYSGTLTVHSDATAGENTISVSGLGLAEFSRIPAGWFTMGRTSGDTDSYAPPAVNVYVSEFYMARHEVTWALWNEVRNWAVNNGYTDIATGGGKGATHPVHSVSWWDVVKWCNARSEREGLTPVYRNADGRVFKTGTTAPTANWKANGYRLPTEAEWEKAARGGVSGQRFPWGDTITHSQSNYYSSREDSYDISPTREYHPTYNDGTEPYTSPVGSFGANGYGLYDMAGNVFEWCWDWYSASAYTEGATDPKGPTSGTGRVLRGGSWRYFARNSRSAGRGWITPGVRVNYLGFRPARSSAAPAPENRSISLSGNLDFGGVVVGAESVRQLQIENQGNVDLTVTGLVLPDAFSGNWTGVIAPGATQGVSITFAPQAEQSYSGTLTVHSDATAGENTISVSGLGLAEFSRIPAGWFTMGRTSGDTDLTNAPPVNVYVSEFYMARHEVTWALWNEVRNWAVNNGYTDIAPGGGKGVTHPVHSVSWWDVVKWCNARSEREGLTPVYRNASGTVFKTGTTAPTANWNANGYRLPTEAEWEKAARGGVSGQRFPWGDTITHSQSNYYSSREDSYDISPTRGYHPTYQDSMDPYTSPVGSFAANGYGLYDMAGNVLEWCWDWYGASTYTEGSTDPKGASSGTGRVYRGGSWNSRVGDPRSAFRSWDSPGVRVNYLGFRPARSSVP